MPSPEDPIPAVYKDFGDVIAYLDAQVQPSFSSFLSSHFRKTLLLSVASYFEKEVSRLLVEFTTHRSNSCNELVSLIELKVIERQYHTFFSWKDTNANTFFAIFGNEFKKRASEQVKNNAQLDEGVKAFLQLGRLRNLLVHENYALFPIETSTQDIYDLYQKAKRFITFLEVQFLPPQQ